MKKILAAICLLALAIPLSSTHALAEGRHRYSRPHYDRHRSYNRHHYDRHRHHGSNAGPIIGGVLGGMALGALGTAIILDANRPRTVIVPGPRTALVQCNMCGAYYRWQGIGNPPPPGCGCPSSYRWDWQP